MELFLFLFDFMNESFSRPVSDMWATFSDTEEIKMRISDCGKRKTRGEGR